MSTAAIRKGQRLAGFAVLVALFAGSFVAPAALAGESQTYSDAQLVKYVQAGQVLDTIAAKWKPKIQAAQDKIKTASDMEDVMLLRADYSNAMTRAIEAHGLTLEQYGKMTRKADKDKQFAQRIKRIAQAN